MTKKNNDVCISSNHPQRALVSQMFLHLSREVLPGLRERFGGEEGGRSHGAGQQSISALKLVTDSKVCDLDVSVFSHQQVGGFHVSVDDPLVMYCWKRNMTDTFNSNKIPFEESCFGHAKTIHLFIILQEIGY